MLDLPYPGRTLYVTVDAVAETDVAVLTARPRSR
jgi:hypothetical protein